MFIGASAQIPRRDLHHPLVLRLPVWRWDLGEFGLWIFSVLFVFWTVAAFRAIARTDYERRELQLEMHLLDRIEPGHTASPNDRT